MMRRLKSFPQPPRNLSRQAAQQDSHFEKVVVATTHAKQGAVYGHSTSSCARSCPPWLATDHLEASHEEAMDAVVEVSRPSMGLLPKDASSHLLLRDTCQRTLQVSFWWRVTYQRTLQVTFCCKALAKGRLKSPPGGGAREASSPQHKRTPMRCQLLPTGTNR